MMRLPRRAALLGLLAAASPAWAGLSDVLERPALRVRRADAAPLLRVARAGRRLVAVGEHGLVVLSDDQGLQWRQARVPVSVTLTGVQFTSERRGYAIGHSAVVLRTDDGGESWTLVLDGRSLPRVLAQRASELAQSTSSVGNPSLAQALARQAEADGPDKPWLALAFDDDLHGYVVGAFGLALETVNGGQSWRSFADQVPNPRSLHLYALALRGGQLFVAGEQGLFARSDDAGHSFSQLEAPYRGSFFALAPLADGGLLLAGLRGTVLRYGPDGQFGRVDSATTQGIVAIARLGGHGLVLVDQSGKLFNANEAGLQFRPLPVAGARRWLSVVDTADGGLVGASFDGLAMLKPELQGKP